jgi:hypothetical protein
LREERGKIGAIVGKEGVDDGCNMVEIDAFG